MKYTIFGCLVAVIIVLSGCSTILENDISDIEQEQSYVPMVNLNGTIYASYDLTKYEKYSTGEVFGEIKKRVPSSDIEKENLTSNYYDEGTVIYNVKEDNKIFLIEESPDIYSILEKLE
ncbi:hypothetical protein ABE61_06330 [Lysinibacillus sphaericus]|uniref:hypothetical protein n=1 Tax=Lysinibacillus sphaericus TaxID=1421 RepID=UPI0018CCBB75|nr:hypothetical protein [Lysinibacillus sphaericus]MBG9453711.1 hypothetical protein [Lysinibacillus sphaericus]MBG9476182.1 hypothetical protein [Lysinibacillus sphaericus]MBG9591596.1 hypothetical protein [Lysinibacillus sphaericus]